MSPRVQLSQVTIEQRVIIRIPVRPAAPPPPAPGAAPGRRASLNAPIPQEQAQDQDTREVKGPKCVKLDKLRGAIINSESGVTMLTDKDEALRMHFSRTCRSADFYSGFYVEPTKDGSICAGRDQLHARNGSTCDIERFGKLVPDD